MAAGYLFKYPDCTKSSGKIPSKRTDTTADDGRYGADSKNQHPVWSGAGASDGKFFCHVLISNDNHIKKSCISRSLPIQLFIFTNTIWTYINYHVTY